MKNRTCLVLAAVAAVLLLNAASPAAHAAIVQKREAETLPASANGPLTGFVTTAGTVDQIDGSATTKGSWGYLKLHSYPTSASVRRTIVTPPASSATFRFRKGAQCLGANPQATVSIDGASTTFSISATTFGNSTASYTFTTSISQGSHIFTVKDTTSGTCDNPLRFDFVRLSGSGTSYYFSDLTGSDTTGDGSVAAPWATVAKANSLSLNPGDAVLFRGGDTFNDTTLVPRNGSSSAPIVYGQWGTGLPTLDAPANRSVILAGSYDFIDLLEQSDLVFGSATDVFNESPEVDPLSDGSWRPYADANPMNTAIAANPTVPSNSPLVVAYLTGGANGGPPEAVTVGDSTINGIDYGHPTYYPAWTGANIAAFKMRCVQSDTCGNSPFPSGNDSSIQISLDTRSRPAYPEGCYFSGATVQNPGGTDCHMEVVAPDGYEYSFWKTYVNVPNRRIHADAIGRIRIDSTTCFGDGGGAGADNLNCGNLAGIIRGPEMQAGVIDHALKMTVQCVRPNSSSAQGWLSESGTPCTDANKTNAPRNGEHFQLTMSDSEIDGLSVPPWLKTILHAFHKYGGYVGDTGADPCPGGVPCGWVFGAESGEGYTALGLTDPWLSYAQSICASGCPTGVTHHGNGTYSFDPNIGGINWGQYLRVIEP